MAPYNLDRRFATPCLWAAGTRVGPYEVAALLGEGGMGVAAAAFGFDIEARKLLRELQERAAGGASMRSSPWFTPIGGTETRLSRPREAVHTVVGGAGAARCRQAADLEPPMRYDFLVDTYATERVKVLSIWSEFADDDLAVRPRPDDPRGRSVHEQMVHQCVSEDLWFRNMLGIDVGAPPLPQPETRLEFIRRYAEDSGKRLERLQQTDELWWEESTMFFDVERSRAWVMTRRLTHTSHHRGQQMAMLRMVGRSLHSNYGPTADTGGLMLNQAPTIYAYPALEALLEGESAGGKKSALPGISGAHGKPVTERPG